MGKKGRCMKNNIQNLEEPDELRLAPHSFVIHRGTVEKSILELTRDFRKVMEPFTASSLKVRKKNAIKDFVSLAGVLRVSHLCVFSSTDKGVYLKIARLPHGPTLTFWIHNFSLAADVVSMSKKSYVFDKLFQNAPLLVLNSFSGEGLQMKLMSTMFQNMFPTINITKVDLSKIRRCILLNYNTTSKLIDFRHYGIKAVPAGVSKGVKKLVQSKVPNLGRLQEISEFITKSGQLSESEAEDDETTHVTLSQKLASRGTVPSGQTALKLIEIGPRMTLQLYKIEEGMMDGAVLFHEIIEKTEEEKLLLMKRRQKKRKLKAQRKTIQQQNVKKKLQMKEELKKKSVEGMQKKAGKELQKPMADKNLNEVEEDEEDDDAEWYKKEVGEDPEKGLFDTVERKRKSPMGGPKHKKRKTEGNRWNENDGETFPVIRNKFGKKNQKDNGVHMQKNKFNNTRHFKNNKHTEGIRNKFGKKKQKNDNAHTQRKEFNRRKVFGSKISKKHRK